MRPILRLFPVLVVFAAGCSQQTAPAPEDVGKVTRAQMQRQYSHLVESYTVDAATFRVDRPWSLLDMIHKAPPSQLRACQANGKAMEDQRGTMEGVRVTVYTTSCGDIFFRLQTDHYDAILGPGGWTADRAVN